MCSVAVNVFASIEKLHDEAHPVASHLCKAVPGSNLLEAPLNVLDTRDAAT